MNAVAQIKRFFGVSASGTSETKGKFSEAGEKARAAFVNHKKTHKGSEKTTALQRRMQSEGA